MLKLYIGKIIMCGAVCSALYSCSDWTKVESINQGTFLENNRSDEYYENLRVWKARKDHQITFGWFGNWTGVDQEHSMRSLPDSLDFISIWGSWKNLTDKQKTDLQYVQEKKGTKALLCFIIANIGDQITPQSVYDNWQEEGYESERAAVNAYWGWVDGDDDAISKAIDKYTQGLCDTIHKYNYDGFDIDYEPNYGSSGNLASYKDRMLMFCEYMKNHLGEGKMLVVDGEPQSMPAEAGTLLDYFIVQAYNSYGDSDLNSRLQSTINNFDGVLTPQEVARKYIVTENFVSYAANGGNSNYMDKEGNTFNSLEGMARWVPVIDGDSIMKGGFGSYHIEYDYGLTFTDDFYTAHPWLSRDDLSYPWTRSGMRALRALESISSIKR